MRVARNEKFLREATSGERTVGAKLLRSWKREKP
jgi:hypothetical protein